MSTTSTPEFSVIITCYFEEKSIDEFYGKLSAALEGLNRSYEIIFVNDGSTDGTFSRLQAIFDRDSKVAAVLDLFKNSGQAAAMTAGFLQARGAKFVFIGRPFNYAASIAGEEGVTHVVNLLRAEIDRNMAMLGINDCRELHPEMLVHTPR